MDFMSYLERLFNENAWRQKQVAKMPPAQMSDMQGPTLEDRFRMLQQPIESAAEKERRLRQLYDQIKNDKAFQNWGPMPKNLWDVWISDQLKNYKDHPMI